MTSPGISAKYRVSDSWRRLAGSIAPIPLRRAPTATWLPHAGDIAAAVHRPPEFTIEEHRGALGFDLSCSAVRRAVVARELTLKNTGAARLPCSVLSQASGGR